MSKGNGSIKDTCLVKCRVEPGMFKGEWLVFLDAIDPENQKTIKVQLFVDQREITRIQGTPRKNQPVEGWLRVSLIKAKGGLAQVVLPQPATPVGENVFLKQDLVDLKNRPLPETAENARSLCCVLTGTETDLGFSAPAYPLFPEWARTAFSL